MVGQQFLELYIGVRIPVPQHMSFKIVSTVSINASQVGEKPIDYPVLIRERQLQIGERIPIKGSITHDVETKGGWINARGEIRVIDNKTIGIRWKPTLGEAIFHSFVESEATGLQSKIREVKEYSKQNEEQILEVSGQKSAVDLQDSYSFPELPEVFSPLDRIQIGPLTEKAMKNIEGIKSIERKTELIYEP